MSGMNYYELLGVNASAGDSEIRRAYLKLSLHWHPDKRRGASSDEAYRCIQEAYETLSCPEKRCLYDFVGAFAMLVDATSSYALRPALRPFSLAPGDGRVPSTAPAPVPAPSPWSVSSGDSAHSWPPSSFGSASRSSPTPSPDTYLSSSPGAPSHLMPQGSSPNIGGFDDVMWSDDPGRGASSPAKAGPSGSTSLGPVGTDPRGSLLPAAMPSPLSAPPPSAPWAGPVSPSSLLGKRRSPSAEPAPAAPPPPAPCDAGAASSGWGPTAAAATAAGGASAAAAPASRSHSADVFHQLLLTLEEMYSGCVKQLRLQRRVFLRPCESMSAPSSNAWASNTGSDVGAGAGLGAAASAAAAAARGGRGASGGGGGCSVVQVEELFRVEVQPGWREGTKVTFPGKGDELPCGSRGDMVLVVAQAAHGTFQRRGNDLHTVVRVPLVDALTGGHTALTTLDGRTLVLGLGSTCLQPFSERVVREEGMPIPPGRRRGHHLGAGAAGGDGAAAAAGGAAVLPAGWGRGDLVVKFQVAFPADLTSEQKEELRRALRGSEPGPGVLME